MKTNWWNTLGVIIVASIIVYLLSVLISIPSIIMGFKSLLTNIKDGEHLPFDFSTGFYVVNSITRLFSQIFSVIPIVIIAFLFFGMVEKMEKPTLMDKIGQIGDNE
jgi:ABC-type amino acid transport system permease subunit